MSNAIFTCGFECGLDVLGSHFSSGRAGTSISTVIKRNGTDRSLHCQLDGIGETFAGNTMVDSAGVLLERGAFVWRVYVYFASLPDKSGMVAWMNELASIGHGVGYDVEHNELRPAYTNVSIGYPVFGEDGVGVTVGQWIRLDVKIRANGTQITHDVRIDGTECTQLIKPAPGLYFFGRLYLGWRMNFFDTVNANLYFDDVLVSATAADYPLGDGSVRPFTVSRDGRHNILTAGHFKKGAAGTNITNATNDSCLLIDDIPMPAGVVTNDYVTQVENGSTEYVEYLFGPFHSPGLKALLPPRHVALIAAFHTAAPIPATFTLKVVDNFTVQTVYSLASGDSVQPVNKFYELAPSGVEWSVVAGSGNFNDLRIRWGYSTDANPDVSFDAVMIEAEFAGVADPFNPDVDDDPPPPGGHYACAGTLPTFVFLDQFKIDDLRSLRATGVQPEVYELVKVSWPDDERYYSVLQVDEVASVAPEVSPIETRLIPGSSPDWFLPVNINSAIGDEEVALDFWDGDEGFSELLVEHGEGIPVELFYFFPQVNLLMSIWQGHLRQEDDATADVCKVKAAQGFRSSEGLLPRRAHWRECQAIFGGTFDNQEDIDQNDCPYNVHIGGSVGVPGFTSCPRRTRADCSARLGHNGDYMLSHATTPASIANNQTHGPNLLSTSQGNESNLKEPVKVVMGRRRVYGMPVLVSRKDFNNNTPDHGFYAAIYEACEGPIQSFTFPRITVDGKTQEVSGGNLIHYNQRLGIQGQNAVSTITDHSYSSTALILYVFGWVNPADISAGDASASAIVEGLNNIRTYTDENTYANFSTDNRAWQLMRMLVDKRWGYGYDYERLDIPAFIEAACWCDNIIQFVDDNGDAWNHVRARSDVGLAGRKLQQQIEDLCMTGRLSRPFMFNGKIHVVPLRVMTNAELSDAPVFTEIGDDRNIIMEETENGFKSLMTISRISELDLPNRIECTYDDAENDWIETPCRPVEDIDAQLRAGRVVGDNSRKINVKQYSLMGVTNEGHAIKCSTALRDLGPFDEGGIQNNLRLKFPIWFIDSLTLFPTKVIRVDSARLLKYGFNYFRVISMERRGDLIVDLTVQAYNVSYMSGFETLYGSLGEMPADPSTPNPAVLARSAPFPLVAESIEYSEGLLSIPISTSG